MTRFVARAGSRIQLADWRSFVSALEEYWSLGHRRLERAAVTLLDGLDSNDEIYRQFGNDLGYKLRQSQEVFPLLYRRATLVALYSWFEDLLNSVCEDVGRRMSLPNFASFRKGKGIERAKTYMEKIVGTSFPAAHESWSRIQDVQRLRNRLVHADGQLNGARPELQDYVRKNAATLSEDNEGRIVVSEKYIVDTIGAMEDFLKELLVALGGEK